MSETTTPSPLTDEEICDYDGPPTCPICDGIHGYHCPIESPDPLYYADEMAAGR